MARVVPFFIVAFGCALIGWAMMVFASRIEHERQERHADKFGEHEPSPPNGISHELTSRAHDRMLGADSAVPVDPASVLSATTLAAQR
jgi:hypothetical protein